MIVTPRDLNALVALADYHLLNRRQLQRLAYPTDQDGRVTRRRLAFMIEVGLVRRHAMLVTSRHDEWPSPIFILAERGLEYLAEEFDDDRFLLKPLRLPHAFQLQHQLAVSQTHMILDSAIEGQAEVKLEAWVNESEIVNPEEPNPHKRFRLFTELAVHPKLVCSPDAGFMLSWQGNRHVLYLEEDRGTSSRGTGARQMANRKLPGYAELAKQQFHRRHFPRTTEDDFRVLLIALEPKRRDALRRAFAEKNPATYRPDLWRFAAETDLTPESFLFGNIIYRCDDQPPGPLVQL